MRRTFDVKYRPKAISSPRSSACFIALSCEKPPAEIQSLPAQIARRKSFDSLSMTRSIEPRTRGSMTRSIEPRTRGSMTCRYPKFGWRLRSSVTRWERTQGSGCSQGYLTQWGTRWGKESTERYQHEQVKFWRMTTQKRMRIQ